MYIGIMSLVLPFLGCTGDNSLGVEIQSQADKIYMKVDTIHIESKDTMINAISAQCSDTMSMVLGEYYSEKYGYMKSDLLLQFAAPIGYEFPPESYNKELDSLVLFMYYTSYFGQNNEPLEISVYELNKSTPDFYTQYLTDFDINQFLDINSSQFRVKKLITTVDQSLSDKERNEAKSTKIVQFKFTDSQSEKFFNMPQSAYSSVNNFLQEFKGLYLTSSYGKSTVIYPYEFDLILFYHYSFDTKTADGVDTTMTVYTSVTYPASEDVRQLASIKRSGLEDKVNKVDSINYITTAAGVYPKFSLPIAEIKQRIKDSLPDKDINSNIFLSSANISFEATEIDSSNTSIPVPSALYILPAREIDQFLKTYSVKQYKDREAQIAVFNQKTNEYTVDMSFLLNKLLKNDNDILSEEFLVVPIDIYYDSKGNPVEFKATKRVGAATFRSGKSKYSPLRMELIYTGL